MQGEITAITQNDTTKPRAVFLFAGAPGVGKTFFAEQTAGLLGLPYKRFDMSEYSEKEANLMFAGSDKVYKCSHTGEVTEFVKEHPHCILLFDEIEKAHLNVIHLFLQILDAGRLRDNFIGEEVSFKDVIVIMTTNAGKEMYEDDSINLATVSQKSILKALSSEISPITHAPLFPSAICSRIAAGNVIMFNRLEADVLLQISQSEFKQQAQGISKTFGINIDIDELLPHSILFAAGGSADGRIVRGNSRKFLYNEMFELSRLIKIENLKAIQFNIQLPEDKEVAELFKNDERSNVLIFADKAKQNKCKKLITSANVFYACTVEQAKEMLEKEEIEVILCDISCGVRGREKVLNIEDIESEGRDFFNYIMEYYNIPTYILLDNNKEISNEEKDSLKKIGAKGVVCTKAEGKYALDSNVAKIVESAYQQRNLQKLARANKVLTYKTLQLLSDDGTEAKISLFDFKLDTAVDAEDARNVLNNVSRPDIKFDDVIGADEAKDELAYYVEYLKNPVKYMRQGVKAPKGILLYGPSGTGKTLLAKAMAGESNVTFIAAEGNQFLKKWVGEGAEAVHKLFATARKYAPAVLFIDEIDAFGMERGRASHTGGEEALNAFLTEMDGFKENASKPVFVLAATNFDIKQNTKCSLDPALVRRFDRRIKVGLPNKEGRLLFLTKKIEKANNTVTQAMLENIATRSVGSSLSALDEVVELAFRNVIKAKESVLTDEILENAFETYNSGAIKKWDESELLSTARHEAGHALMCWLGGEKPSYLTIVARGDHGGYMQHSNNENKNTYTKRELISKVRTSLAGRAAEVVYYGDEDGISTGASADLQNATNLVQTMLCTLGMDPKIGLCSVDLNSIIGTPYYMTIINRMNEILKEEFESTKEIISKHRVAIDKLVEQLIEKDSLKDSEIDDILSEYCQESQLNS